MTERIAQCRQSAPGQRSRRSLQFGAGCLRLRDRRASRSSFAPAFGILGETVAKLDPSELAARVCVVPRWYAFRVVEAACRHVDFIRGTVVLEGQLRAAARAEGASAFCRRSEPAGRAPDKLEPSARHADPGYKGSAGSSTANRAVADRLVKRRTCRFVSDDATEATALQHIQPLLTCQQTPARTMK